MISSSVSPVTADDDSMSTCLSISFSVCALYECLLVVVEMLQALQLSRVGTSNLYVSSDGGLKVSCDSACSTL